MNFKNIKLLLSGAAMVGGLIGFQTAANAATYEIRVVNVTRGQSFTPRLAVTHSEGNIFAVGEVAIPEVVAIAESGSVDSAVALLESIPEFITDMVVMGGLLDPGKSETFTIEGNPGDRFTLLNMLIPTNDAFLAMNGVSLPASGSTTSNVLVYDAGSEPNDELCANIPGPRCGGTGASPDADGEGFIHIHAGIHGVGDISAATYDWRVGGARVTITRMP